MRTDSNLGKWNRWYASGLEDPQPYADTVTYRIAADWVASCAQVEDWGCGKGWLSTLISPERYRGVDGSYTPFAHVIADLRSYRSDVDGVCLRHVLEHDYGWPDILSNAVASARRRLVVVLFTPLVETTHEVRWWPDPGVPDIAFRADDLTRIIEAGKMMWQLDTIATPTPYGQETVLKCRRERC